MLPLLLYWGGARLRKRERGCVINEWQISISIFWCRHWRPLNVVSSPASLLSQKRRRNSIRKDKQQIAKWKILFGLHSMHHPDTLERSIKFSLLRSFRFYSLWVLSFFYFASLAFTMLNRGPIAPFCTTFTLLMRVNIVRKIFTLLRLSFLD